jgi:thymidylate synthase (FAD)
MSDYQKSIDLYADYGDGIGRVDYVQHMGSDILHANAARVSFGKHKEVLDESDEKLIYYMIEHGHTSPFEHSSVTFRFKVPLYTRSQHHRHRTWSYNEISRRYTDFNIEFYEPNKFRTQHKTNRQASNADELIDPWYIEPNPRGLEFEAPERYSEAIKRRHKEALAFYEKMLADGICKELARGELPQSMYTEYYGTVNLSNCLKFIDLRDHDGAQEEIARPARACLEIVTDLFPVTVAAYREIRGAKHG